MKARFKRAELSKPVVLTTDEQERAAELRRQQALPKWKQRVSVPLAQEQYENFTRAYLEDRGVRYFRVGFLTTGDAYYLMRTWEEVEILLEAVRRAEQARTGTRQIN